MKEFVSECARRERVARAIDQAFAVKASATHDGRQRSDHCLGCKHARLEMQFAFARKGKDAEHAAEIKVDGAHMKCVVHARVDEHAIDVNLGIGWLEECDRACCTKGKACDCARNVSRASPFCSNIWTVSSRRSSKSISPSASLRR